MADVTKSNLFSESRNNVVSIINDNVSDPLSTSGQYRKWIYSRYPDVKDTKFAGYPFIIVHPADVDIEQMGSVSGKSKSVNWEIEVEIVTSDRGYGDLDGQGLSNMDTISNSIIKELIDLTNRQILQGYSMFFSQPETTAVIQDVVADELIYRRSIMFTFRTRMQISS